MLLAQQAAFLTGPTWNRFLAEAGGSWDVRWCAATGTPSAIYGSGIALAEWRGNTIDEARRQALQLLQQQHASWPSRASASATTTSTPWSPR